MSSFLIKSFKGGISDFEDKGLAGSYKFASGIDPRKRADTLSCQQALTDDLAVGTMDALVKFIVPSNDGNTYLYLTNGKIYKRTSAGVYSLVYTDASAVGDGGIVGACEWYNDQGHAFQYWATKTRLNRKQVLNGTTVVDATWSDVNATVNGQTYPKTNLTSTDYHIMTQVNGVLLGGNKNTLFQVGYDDSYTTNALQLIPGNIARALIERGRYAVVGCGRLDDREKSDMFGWDGDATNWNFKKTIPIQDINALIDTEYPLMQVGTNGALYYADNETILPITKFPDGGQVNPDAVDVDENLALFGVYGNGTGKTGVYSFGRKNKNSDPILNLEYQLNCDEIGSVKNIGSDILISYSSGSSYGVKKVDTSNKATGTYQSLDLKMPLKAGTKLPTIKKIRLTMDSMPSGCSVAVSRKIDKQESFTLANLLDGSTSFSTVGGREADFFIRDEARITEIQVVLTPSGNNTPEIYTIEMFFDE